MRQHRQACNYSEIWYFKVSLQCKLKCFFLLFTMPVKPKTHPILRTRHWFTHYASPKGLYLKTKALPWTWSCIWDHCLQTKHFKFKHALEDKVWLCQKNSEKVSSGHRLLHAHPLLSCLLTLILPTSCNCFLHWGQEWNSISGLSLSLPSFCFV